jgi:hypothetical protein
MNIEDNDVNTPQEDQPNDDYSNVNVKSNIDELRKTLSYLSKGYKVPKIIYDVIFDIAKREIEDKRRVVLIKRDPDVHKGRIQSVYAKIIDGETINVHPSIVGGFGADFDGDSVDCYVNTYKKDKNNNMLEESVHISSLPSLVKQTELKSIKYKNDDILVYDYNILDDIYVKAIDITNGDVDYKKITGWSIHTNVDMYEVSSEEHVLDSSQLLVSSDHSMVAYDNDTDEFVRVSPKILKENPKRYYLVKSK